MLCLAGCSSPRSGSTWWNPSTWFSGREGVAVEQAQVNLEARKEAVVDARNDVLIAAQIEVHKTGAALDLAPTDDPAVRVAARTNTNATDLLDKALGAPEAGDLAALRQMVTDLVAQVPAALAEQVAAEERARGASTALAQSREDLAKAQHALGAAQDRLANAFARENALANQLRNERLLKYAGAGASILLALAAWYFRSGKVALVKGVGTALADLRSDTAVSAAAVNALDVNLSPALQTLIAAAKGTALANTHS